MWVSERAISAEDVFSGSITCPVPGPLWTLLGESNAQSVRRVEKAVATGNDAYNKTFTIIPVYISLLVHK